MNNANFSSFAVVNMAANTIVLANDVLGIINNFGTGSGLRQFWRQRRFWRVEFIQLHVARQPGHQHLGYLFQRTAQYPGDLFLRQVTIDTR